VSAIIRDKTPAELRQDQARRLAVRLGLDGDALYDAAAAAWDNLGCQRYTFDQALSVAGVALRAAAERQEKHDRAAAWAARRQPQPPSPPVHGFSDQVGLDRLDTGVVVERELSARTGDTFTSAVPCCGRDVTVRLEDRSAGVHAACCHCGVLYRAGLRDEDDGIDDQWDEPFYLVVFEVIDLGLAAARHRRGKHEKSRRPAAPGPRPSAQKPPGRAQGQDRPAHPGGLW
jgi:hypothetical protein